METILIIEDDKNLNKGLSIALEKDYRVISTKYMKDAIEHLGTASLILLDMNLPDGDGLELIKYTRKNFSTPIIVLSAIDLEPYIISAIELGADDYMTKPFSLGILQAKIKRILENIKDAEINIYNKGAFSFNFQENIFKLDSAAIDFTPTESKILYYLISHRKQIATKDILIDGVWGMSNAYIDQNTISVNISRIRTKLLPYKPIETIFGVGYKWVY